MTSVTQIREAKREDINQILLIATQVHIMVQQHRSQFVGKPIEFTGTDNRYIQAIQMEDNTVFVAEAEGEVVGYVYATIERAPDDLITMPYISINELAVKTGLQGSGIGKALMDRICEWSREKRLNVVQLAVWEFNKGAVEFYEKLGYKTIMRKMEKVIK